MFNSRLKKEWLEKMEQSQEKFKTTMTEAQNSVISLFGNRKSAVTTINQVQGFLNTITNTPKEFIAKAEKTDLLISEFTEVATLKDESEITNKISGGIAGAGVVAGAGVAVLGPTAAMAIATTFGTASTGTAIASLSGAAATNAALAWLGGGALVAGGGGTAAGSALLALAGPIGWTIGGVAILGGILLASSKNKKIAAEAEENVYKLETATNDILKKKAEIDALSVLTADNSFSLEQHLSKVMNEIRHYITNYKRSKLSVIIHKFISLFSKKSKAIVAVDDKIDYSILDKDLKFELGALVNNALSLAELVGKKLA